MVAGDGDGRPPVDITGEGAGGGSGSASGAASGSASGAGSASDSVEGEQLTLPFGGEPAEPAQPSASEEPLEEITAEVPVVVKVSRADDDTSASASASTEDDTSSEVERAEDGPGATAADTSGDTDGEPIERWPLDGESREAVAAPGAAAVVAVVAVAPEVEDAEVDEAEAVAEAGEHGHRRLYIGAAIGTTIAAAMVLVASTTVALYPGSRRHLPPIVPPSAVASAYLTAWTHENWPAMAALVASPPADFVRENAGTFADLAVTKATFVPGVAVAGPGDVVEPFTATLMLAALGSWTYSDSMTLHRVGRQWLIRWSPAVIQPALTVGVHFAWTRTLAARAPILADNGTSLADVPNMGGIVGSTGAATATLAAALGAPVMPGDIVGTSGLEETYNTQLSGQPSGDVVLEDSSGVALQTVHHFPGVAPAPITTTIDPTIQSDANNVLANVSKPAALVAMDTTTGQVRAIVSHPDGGYPRALVGSYPPGSTFKVVTSTAALEAGIPPYSSIACPAKIDVGGRDFQNAENEVLGTITFQQAFAQSCNTAFIGISEKLSDADLEAAAATYGIGGNWAFPVPHYAARPPPQSLVEHAADSIGQGTDSVSPLEMCSIATAVAFGAWRPPTLVVGVPQVAPTPLPPDVDTNLKTFMRSVVTSGTGTVANLPGDPVYGKTGTAEYGTATPPATHAWFIGWRDNLAFAVIVEGGGFGGQVAAPLAARFLSNL